MENDFFVGSKVEGINMEIQIISKEIIKPSAPTPHHLRTYKLSAVDQLAAFAADIPIILFLFPYR
uniref:Uncharacterized protein n=1 Tax=Salix viminalis TaxID=40686 RepID=A0A6N2KB76_SALVM